MKTNFYETTFVNASGIVERSRLFQTIRAARTWAKWLAKQKFVQSVSIYKGGAGGELVS